MAVVLACGNPQCAIAFEIRYRSVSGSERVSLFLESQSRLIIGVHQIAEERISEQGVSRPTQMDVVALGQPSRDPDVHRTGAAHRTKSAPERGVGLNRSPPLSFNHRGHSLCCEWQIGPVRWRKQQDRSLRRRVV